MRLQCQPASTSLHLCDIPAHPRPVRFYRNRGKPSTPAIRFCCKCSWTDLVGCIGDPKTAGTVPRATFRRRDHPAVCSLVPPVCRQNLIANNASAGKLLRCRAFVTVMRAAEVRNPDDLSDTQDPPNMRTLLVDS